MVMNLRSSCARRGAVERAAFTGTDLAGTDLAGSDLAGTDLAGTDFTRADFTRAARDIFVGEGRDGVRLRGAMMRRTRAAEATVSCARRARRDVAAGGEAETSAAVEPLSESMFQLKSATLSVLRSRQSSRRG